MMSLSPINSLGEIRRRHPSRNPLKKVREDFSWWDRAALRGSEIVATWWLFLILGLGTALWVGLNYFGVAQVDKVPDLAWWSLICNGIQLLLLPLILAGQNVQSRRDDARAEYDLEIDERAEKEVDSVLQQLNDQNIMLKALLEKQGIEIQKGSI